MYKILLHQIKNYDKSPLNLYRTDFNIANFRSYLSLGPSYLSVRLFIFKFLGPVCLQKTLRSFITSIYKIIGDQVKFI